MDGKPVELSTKCYVEAGQWNSQKGWVKGSSEKARTINHCIKQLELQSRQQYNTLRDISLPPLCPGHQAAHVGRGRKETLLLSVFTYHNAQMKAQVVKEYASGTMERYQTTLKLLQHFMSTASRAFTSPISSMNSSPSWSTTSKRSTNAATTTQPSN